MVLASEPRLHNEATMHSKTQQLPKTHSYPVKPSQLRYALAEAGVEIDVHLTRSHSSHFAAHYWPPNANVDHERIYLQVGSVTRVHARQARDRWTNEVIPKLVNWIEAILTEPINSPVRRQTQELDLSLS